MVDGDPGTTLGHEVWRRRRRWERDSKAQRAPWIRSAVGDAWRLGRGLFTAALRAQRRRAALRELEALDDRILKDIGLSRSALPHAVDRMLVERMLGAPGDRRREPAVTAAPSENPWPAGPDVERWHRRAA